MMKTSARALVRLGLCSAFAMLAVSTAGCRDSTVRVAVVLPETGGASSYGVALRQGVEVAFEELAADPDYPLELKPTYVDSQGDPERAAAELERLFDEGAVVAIGGATSDEALAMVPVADRFDRILLSPSASTPILTGISNNFFRIYSSDFLEATRMANFASQTLGLDRVVVVAEEQTYGRGIQSVFTDELERYGGTILEVLEYPPNTADFSGFAERVITLDPQAVYLAGYDTGVGGMIKALSRRRYRGKVLTTHAFASPSAIARTGAAAEGVLLTQTVFDVSSDYAHINTFVNAYQARWGEQPDLFAAHGYDAVKVLAAGIEGRTLIANEIRKGLRSLGDFPGVTGSLQFDENGDVKKFPRVFIVSDDLAVYNYDSYVAEQKKALMARLSSLRAEAKELQ